MYFIVCLDLTNDASILTAPPAPQYTGEEPASGKVKLTLQIDVMIMMNLDLSKNTYQVMLKHLTDAHWYCY